MPIQSTGSPGGDDVRAAALDVPLPNEVPYPVPQLPPVVSLSESTANADGAHWSAARVAGVEVIGKSSTGWTGALAGAGPFVDLLNASLCYDEVPNPANLSACIRLFDADVQEAEWNRASGNLATATFWSGSGSSTKGADIWVATSHASQRNDSRCGQQTHADLFEMQYFEWPRTHYWWTTPDRYSQCYYYYM